MAAAAPAAARGAGRDQEGKARGSPQRRQEHSFAMDPYRHCPWGAFNSPLWTTNSGVPVWNNNNSLTVGARGDFNCIDHIMQTEDGDGNFGVLLRQGAEARVFESNFLGRKSIVKERFSKKYRHPTLDSKLTLKRLNAEARCMTKARRLGVLTPTLYAVDPLFHTLTFEYIEGVAVKDLLLDFGSHGVIEEKLSDVAMQIGNAIGKLHDGGLVHGDLTTSNMIIQKETNQLVLIDFGLSFTSTLPEDKAVDLYVLDRALLSMHSSCGNLMDRILSAYRKSSKQWCATLNKLAQVRQRGRKRTMVG